MTPIGVLLTLLITLDISHTILFHRWLIIPSSDDFKRESLSSYVATTNAFIELGHYAGALISTYTCEDRVGITVKKKVSINRVYRSAFLLTILASVGSTGSLVEHRPRQCRSFHDSSLIFHDSSLILHNSSLVCACSSIVIQEASISAIRRSCNSSCSTWGSTRSRSCSALASSWIRSFSLQYYSFTSWRALMDSMSCC